MDSTQQRIESDDISVFTLQSLTGWLDRTALLRALNLAVFVRGPDYVYGEVGSYLGGTLVAPLLDTRCRKVVAIDSRPPSSPDERGVSFPSEVTATDMINNLRSTIPQANLSKLEAFDVDAADLPSDAISGVDVCFIDGEHTNRAAFSDFMAMMRFCAKDCIILFHDANLVSDALRNVETYLRYSGRRFRTACVPDVMFVVLLGEYASAPSNLLVGERDKEEFFKLSKEVLWTGIAETYVKMGRVTAV